MANKIMGAVRTGLAQDGSVSSSNAFSFYSTYDCGEAEWPAELSPLQQGGERPVTAAEVAAIVRQVMSEMKVYVLESDITDAQNAVKGIVEQSYF